MNPNRTGRPRETRMRRRAVAVTAAATAVLVCAAAPASALVERVSLGDRGQQGDWNAVLERPAISDNGRFVAFGSQATNLVAGDTNDENDVFVRDRLTRTTERVSVANDGAEGDRNSWQGGISANGRHVVFTTFSALSPDDQNDAIDVYLRDRVAGTTERISVGAGGTDALGFSRADGDAISADGRYVVFSSTADNIVAGDANGRRDVFVRDRVAGTTVRVSLGPGGQELTDDSIDPAISRDGRWVAYASIAEPVGPATDRWNVYRRDLRTGATVLVSAGLGGAPANGDVIAATISDDGNRLAFTTNAGNLVSGDANGFPDVFVRDVASRRTELISVDLGGQPAGEGADLPPDISGNGRRVVFSSGADDIVPGDGNWRVDAFVRDTSAGVTLVARTWLGRWIDEGALAPAITGDGTQAAFVSISDDVVPFDTNIATDVFVTPGVPALGGSS